MKKDIVAILQKHVEVYGFVSVDEYIARRNQKKGEILVHTFLDGYKTIITLGIAYPKDEVRFKGKGYGLLSRYSYGVDYHIVFRNILSNIETELQSLGITSTSAVDITPLNERDASFYAHMGYLGKNDFLIHKTYGSYLYLATIFVDTVIEKDLHELDDCGTCTKCIDACPSNALRGGFNMEKCISYTTQTKKEFTIEEIRLLKVMVYGCDICQKVCPKNTGINYHLYKEFEPTGIENLDLKKMLSYTNKEYMALYKDNASSWRGSLVMKRNALCVLYNQRQFDTIDLIKESLQKYQDVLWYNKTAQTVINLMESE